MTSGTVGPVLALEELSLPGDFVAAHAQPRECRTTGWGEGSRRAAVAEQADELARAKM
jgi:hypothetical protein